MSFARKDGIGKREGLYEQRALVGIQRSWTFSQAQLDKEKELERVENLVQNSQAPQAAEVAQVAQEIIERLLEEAASQQQ